MKIHKIEIMKTIYYYGIDNNKGGMEAYAFNLIKGVLSQSKEYSFHIFSIFDDFAYKNELVNELKCKYTVLPNPKKHPFKYQKVISNVLKNRKDSDILHVNLMSFRNIFLLHSIKKANMKTIIVGHSINTNGFSKKLFHKFGRKIYGKLWTKVGMNQRVLDFMYQKNSQPQFKISNGIELDKFSFNLDKRNEIRKQLNLSENEIAIGQIGRLSKQKNQVFTCEIARKLENQNATIFFFGKATEKHIQKLISKKKPKNIKVMGQVNNIVDVYNAMDLIIMPSKFEAGSLALYEGLANECNTIISPHVPSDAIESEYLKILSLDADIWANEILIFCKNYKGRTLNEKNILPSLDDQIKNYLKLYNSL